MLRKTLVTKEYYFRRTYFMISDDEFVELVALTTSTNVLNRTELHESKDTLATDSIERHITELTRRKAKLLLQNEVITEQFVMNRYQFNYLFENFIDDLLKVTKEIIDSIEKDR